MSEPETSNAGGLDPVEICTLTPDARSQRVAWIRERISPHVIAAQPIARGLALELADRPGVSAALDRLVALERACCPGIDFERVAAAAPDRLRLEVRGVDSGADLLRRLGVPEPTAHASDANACSGCC